MVERKTKRNARRSKRRGDFRICGEPVVHTAEDARSPALGDKMPLLPRYDRPMLFAIARDERTIFASWEIHWPSVLKKNMPADRQVYIRIIGHDGSEQKRVAVEPMLGLHYLTTSGLHDSYRIEIGYYQPTGTWHSVAISDMVKMRPQGSAKIPEVDVATIPFHLRFQQLVNLFGAGEDTPLAKVLSRFQNFAVNSRPNELPAAATQILRKLNLSRPAIAAARRDFEKIDSAKLPRRRRALPQFAGTSPSRLFDDMPVRERCGVRYFSRSAGDSIIK